MGLLVAEDGHFQGWLAVLLCCFAAVGGDEHPVEVTKSRPSTRAGTSVCNDQPGRTSLPAYPSTIALPSYVPDDKPGLELFGVDKVDNAAAPLPLQDTPSSTPPSRFARRPGNLIAPRESRQIDRPSTHASNGFRRLDGGESQRQSLKPLKLAPVVLRNNIESRSPSEKRSHHHHHHHHHHPHHHQPSDSTQDPLASTRSDSYLESRETPFQRSIRHSTDQLSVRQVQPSRQSSVEHLSPMQDKDADCNSKRSSSSLRSQAVEHGAATTTHTRSSSELSRTSNRLKRKSSRHLDDAESPVDKEVQELNTIVEERRVSLLPSSTSTRHVSAVAPAMHIAARSETLNDIGSALSRPLTARDPKTFDALLQEDDDRPSRPFTSSGNGLRSRSGSRVSGWLSGILPPSSFASQPPTNNPIPAESFYKYNTPTDPHTRTHSATSHSSCTSAEQSPTETTPASSPMYKSHSRNLTSESRLIHTSAPSLIPGTADADKPTRPKRGRDSTIANTEMLCEQEGWPALVHSPSQVGLAL